MRSSAKAEVRLMIRVDRRVNVVAADGRDNEIMSFVSYAAELLGGQLNGR